MGFLGIGGNDDDKNAAAAAAAAAQAAADKAAFESQRQSVIDQAVAAANAFVEGKKDALNQQANDVNAVARDLNNNFSGFMTGAIQPLYKTTDANVNVRQDGAAQPYMTKDVIQQGISAGTVAVILGIAYFIFKGRK